MSTALTGADRSGGTARGPLVMGIVNVTPDSFSDGGQHADASAAIAHGKRLLDEGADILDVGGESTRPGAAAVSLAEERERVLPVIEALASQGATVSVDTSKPELMREAVAAGARMVNDVNALRAPGALDAAAELGVTVCIMHMQGTPRTMQDAPHYDDVVGEVRGFLLDRARQCIDAGVARDRIILDPGFGFGKSAGHNLRLLQCLPALTATGFDVLVGLSRKSVLQSVTGRAVSDRLSGSLAMATLAAWLGAAIVRVHDVAETRDAMQVVEAVAGAPGAARRDV